MLKILTRSAEQSQEPRAKCQEPSAKSGVIYTETMQGCARAAFTTIELVAKGVDMWTHSSVVA